MEKTKKALKSRIRERNLTSPWYFSDDFLFLLVLTVIFSPIVPVLSWLRGPRTSKHLGIVFAKSLAIVAVFSVFYIVGNLNNNENAQTRQAPTEFVMPNVIGASYGEFINNADYSELIEVHPPDVIDLTGYGLVWGDVYDWTVVTQSPTAGTKLKPKETICIGVARLDREGLTQDLFECWQQIAGFDNPEDFIYEISNEKVMKITLSDPELEGYFLKAEVKIEMNNWGTAIVTYCSTDAVGPNGSASIELMLDNRQQRIGPGDPSYEARKFLDWGGEYSYRVEKLEKSNGFGCFS